MSLKHYKNTCVHCKHYVKDIKLKSESTDSNLSIEVKVGICVNVKSDHHGHVVLHTHSSCKEIEK